MKSDEIKSIQRDCQKFKTVQRLSNIHVTIEGVSLSDFSRIVNENKLLQDQSIALGKSFATIDKDGVQITIWSERTRPFFGNQEMENLENTNPLLMQL